MRLKIRPKIESAQIKKYNLNGFWELYNDQHEDFSLKNQYLIAILVNQNRPRWDLLEF